MLNKGEKLVGIELLDKAGLIIKSSGETFRGLKCREILLEDNEFLVGVKARKL